MSKIKNFIICVLFGVVSFCIGVLTTLIGCAYVLTDIAKDDNRTRRRYEYWKSRYYYNDKES